MRKFIALALAGLAALATAQNEPLFSTLDEAEYKQMPKPMLKVLCAPDKVMPGEDYYVTFEWWSAIDRPLVVHLDLLDAKTKAWITGDEVEVTGAAGKVTTRIEVPQSVWGKDLKWNAYLAPQAENWPNALVTTTFEAPIGQRTNAPCAPLRNFVRDAAKKTPDFNYVVVTSYPTGFRAGDKTQVEVQYNVVPGSEPLHLQAKLLKNSDNSPVAFAETKAEEGEHTAKLTFDVPSDASTEPVHIMALLKSPGRSFSERAAEDRVWSTAIYHARKNLRA